MKSRIIIFVLLLFSFFGSISFAAEIAPEGTAARKFQRGFLNIALSPVEFAHQLSVSQDQNGFPPGWVIGIVRGGAAIAGRSLAGLYEIMSAPFDPAQGPILKPEFAWERFEKTA